jgi:hypothetical protein
VLENNDQFYRCTGCGQVYWEGPIFQAAYKDLCQILPHLEGHNPSKIGQELDNVVDSLEVVSQKKVLDESSLAGGDKTRGSQIIEGDLTKEARGRIVGDHADEAKPLDANAKDPLVNVVDDSALAAASPKVDGGADFLFGTAEKKITVQKYEQPPSVTTKKPITTTGTTAPGAGPLQLPDAEVNEKDTKKVPSTSTDCTTTTTSTSTNAKGQAQAQAQAQKTNKQTQQKNGLSPSSSVDTQTGTKTQTQRWQEVPFDSEFLISEDIVGHAEKTFRRDVAKMSTAEVVPLKTLNPLSIFANPPLRDDPKKTQNPPRKGLFGGCSGSASPVSCRTPRRWSRTTWRECAWGCRRRKPNQTPYQFR